MILCACTAQVNSAKDTHESSKEPQVFVYLSPPKKGLQPGLHAARQRALSNPPRRPQLEPGAQPSPSLGFLPLPAAPGPPWSGAGCGGLRLAAAPCGHGDMVMLRRIACLGETETKESQSCFAWTMATSLACLNRRLSGSWRSVPVVCLVGDAPKRFARDLQRVPMRLAQGISGKESFPSLQNLTHRRSAR